ncbi:MAG: hypothetical protein ABW164_07345 [Sphingobium sp.]
MTRSIFYACLPALLLAACGRAEPVADMPTQEELAAAANAAAAQAMANAKDAEGQADERNYINQEHGFAMMFPEGWMKDEGASNATGAVYRDPGAGAEARVFWQGNENNQTLQQIVNEVSNGSEGVDGDFVSSTEYLGTANDGEGNAVAVRLLRQPNGSIVTATFVYPEMLGEQYKGIADGVLKSLRVFMPEGGARPAQGSAAQASTVPDAGNAANAAQ